MFRITLSIFVFAFLLFRPYQYQAAGPFYGGDDYSYFAYSTSFAFLEFPSFQKEFVDEANIPPLSRVGPGLMALPFVAAFSLIDRIQNRPIVEVRTRENIPQSWAAFGAVLAAGFFLWMSCYLIFQGLRLFVSDKVASMAVILTVILQGTPLYAYRRPVFSHVYELFLQSLFFFLFTRKAASHLKTPRAFYDHGLGEVAAVVLVSTFTCLVRQNGLVYATLWPVLILSYENGRLRFKHFKKVTATLLLSYALYSFIKYFPFYWDPKPYAAVNALFESSSFMFKVETIRFYAERSLTIFFGVDWGLVFTAPFLILGIFGLMLRNLPDRKLWIGLALPLLVNIYIIIVWRGQGSWYGYRYLLFVAMPVLALPFGFLLMHLRVRRSTLFYFACALGIFPLVSMLMFEAGPGLWLAVYKNEYGATPWTHPTFQKAVWSTVFATPKDAIFYVVKAGPCYVVYLLAHALGFAAALPEKFLKVYPFLDKELILKSLLIYALPWVLYLKRGRKSLKAYASTS